MPGREDPEEPAFVEVRQENADVGRQLSESRDMTPVGVAAREPFESSEALANPSHADVKSDDAEPSTDEVVSNLVIHEDRPIENLPTMSAPELKLIGRCVSLCVMRKVDSEGEPFYYTGLVASVTFAAVTLMYVNRYTRSDFKSYMAREKQVSKAGPQAAVEGEVGVGGDGGLASTQDAAALLRLDAAGSLAAAVRLLTEDEIGAAEPVSSRSPAAAAAAAQTPTRALWHKKFRESTGSVGPLPYVTFLRKNIHDVAFGRDPRSSFYSLFQDPSKQLLDMQYLRMFVRRYLVHTSEGNNPRQVPLYAFVTVRCACPSVDRELVSRVAREELPGLMKADKPIEKEKQRLQEEQRETEGAATSWTFAQTNIECLTCIRQQCFIAGAVLAALTLIAEVYLCASLSALTDNLIRPFLQEKLLISVFGRLVLASTSVATILDSLYMFVPLAMALLTIAVFLFAFSGVFFSLVVLISLALETSSTKIHEFMTKQSEDDLCAFYQAHQGTGFYSSCAHRSAATTGDALCRPSCLVHVAYETTCHSAMTSPVQVAFLPMMVFSVLSLFACLYSLLLLIRLLPFAHSAARRRTS